ncbi:MAG: NAD(P)/FAD-dependent oxidoreductase [Acidobacteriota bacterium]
MDRSKSVFDVCILGGGLIGNMQARHLRRTLPRLSVAVVDQRTDEEVEKSRKVGESTVDIAGIFLSRDLDLHEYLTEHHLPKQGLNFHFPDGSGTERLSDYINYFAHFVVGIPTFQLERRTMEADLLRMNESDGVQLFHPHKVVGVSRNGEGYKVDIESVGDKSRSTLRAGWVIDASGRKRILNRMLIKGNYQVEPKPNTASYWVRVKNPDRRFFNDDKCRQATMYAPYYGTNHFMGRGHWIWMIPLHSDEVSIGIVFDKTIVPLKQVYGRKKFLDFLSREHRLLYKLVMSGEIVDELALSHLAYGAKQCYGADRWALIGDAVAFQDPFLSFGISLASMGITLVTELIRRDLIDHCPRHQLERLAQDYNGLIGYIHKNLIQHYGNMYDFIEDPRCMQEKIRFNVMMWFRVIIPTFVTRIYLRPFLLKCIRFNLFANINPLLDELFCDLKESSYAPKFYKQLYRVHKVIKVDYLNDCIFHSCSYNPMPEIIHMYWYSIKLRLRLLWGVYGLKAFARGRQLGWLARHFVEMLVSVPISIAATLYCRGKTRNPQLEKQELKYQKFVNRSLQIEKGRREPSERVQAIPRRVPDYESRPGKVTAA